MSTLVAGHTPGRPPLQAAFLLILAESGVEGQQSMRWWCESELAVTSEAKVLLHQVEAHYTGISCK